MNETLSYSSIRNSRIAQESTEKLKSTRKRNALVLVWNFLQEMGYFDASKALEREVNLDFNHYAACDNIDLETVLQDFESFYYVRFQKYPQIVKKVAEECPQQNNASLKTKSAKYVNNNPEKLSKRRSYSCVPTFTANPSKKSDENGTTSPHGNLSLDGQQIQHGSNSKQNQNGNENPMPSHIKEKHLPSSLNYDDVKLLKSLNLFAGGGDEWRELAAVISKDIYQNKPNIRWNDIIGLDEAKRLIKEAVVYPIRYPQLFSGILSPWKGLLLYGPPGTGKTLIAKAVATECNTTFFNISASTVVSKWRGDSEKLIRVLFDLARFHSPSTIFVDELDALMSQRNASSGICEHEGSRRMKTELLIQLDGLARSNDLVFLLAASNLPWELDHAILRRLEKRILVDVPIKSAREAMLRTFLPPVTQSKDGLQLHCDLNYKKLAEMSEGYSGADIRLVCKEAAMRKVRKIFDILEHSAGEKEYTKLTVDTITTEDVEIALKKTRSSAKIFYPRYEAWQKEFGSV